MTTALHQGALHEGARHEGAAAHWPGTPASHELRLTRRGRAVLVALLAVLLFAAFSLGRVAAEGTDAAPGAGVRTVTVLPGDTLWGLARTVAPDGDPRPVVEQIRALNDLDGGELRVGEQLVLPVAG